jgi:UDP-glucose 4-epimerase
VPPELFDLVLTLPLLDTGRARNELAWTPRHSSLDALSELLRGLHRPDGLDTPPLSPATSGPLRVREILTGVGAHA